MHAREEEESPLSLPPLHSPSKNPPRLWPNLQDGGSLSFPRFLFAARAKIKVIIRKKPKTPNTTPNTPEIPNRPQIPHMPAMADPGFCGQRVTM